MVLSFNVNDGEDEEGCGSISWNIVCPSRHHHGLLECRMADDDDDVSTSSPIIYNIRTALCVAQGHDLFHANTTTLS
jgi:hypothetical protein